MFSEGEVKSPYFLPVWWALGSLHFYVFFIFKSAGEGEGWCEGDSTWLIHYKKNTDSQTAVLLNSFKCCEKELNIYTRILDIMKL
jgi:hypothetical protein